MFTTSGMKFQILMRAESESESVRWVQALNDLHNVLIKNEIVDKSVSNILFI